MVPAGSPDLFKRIALTGKNVEVHHSPGGFQEQVQIAIAITFGETEVVKGEPVTVTLRRLAEFVERTINIFEGRGLGGP